MYKRALFALLLALACALGSPGFAQAPYPRAPYGAAVMPLDRILPGIRNGRAGRFYDAEGPFPDAEGRYHYRIKWLTPQGRVVWLDADARSGRVLGTARGDWRERGPPSFGALMPPPGPRYGSPGPFGGPHGGMHPGRGNFGGGGWHGGGGRGRGH